MNAKERKSLRFKLELQRNAQFREITAQQQQLDSCCAVIIQMTMFDLASRYPTITHFSYDAVIDDSGDNFFWSPTFYMVGLDDDAFVRETDMVVHDELSDYGYSEKQVMLAFESKSPWYGTIAVDHLRRYWEEESLASPQA